MGSTLRFWLERSLRLEKSVKVRLVCSMGKMEKHTKNGTLMMVRWIGKEANEIEEEIGNEIAVTKMTHTPKRNMRVRKRSTRQKMLRRNRTAEVVLAARSTMAIETIFIRNIKHKTGSIIKKTELSYGLFQNAA